MSFASRVKNPALLMSAAIAMTMPLAIGVGPSDPYSHLPSSITLTGVIRDFRERSVSGGHPDFERQPDDGFGHYMQECQDTLDADGKPVFRSTGLKVATQWRDAQGRNRISPKSYINSMPGDVNGSFSTGKDGSTTNAANFSKWFRDIPGVNMSKPQKITLVRQPGTNTYTFNDRTDPLYKNKGGFFPIDGDMMGNSANSSHNYHFTFELQTTFKYEKGTNQVFSFTGDDDVFVFIDNKLVIDLGGVHEAMNQSINLDRLNWLVDGQTYTLKFFFAERHRTESNCRIDTNIVLRTIEPPSVTAVFD
jgi:fibro-slime domain-containing protein